MTVSKKLGAGVKARHVDFLDPLYDLSALQIQYVLQIQSGQLTWLSTDHFSFTSTPITPAEARPSSPLYPKEPTLARDAPIA